MDERGSLKWNEAVFQCISVENLPIDVQIKKKQKKAQQGESLLSFLKYLSSSAIKINSTACPVMQSASQIL